MSRENREQYQVVIQAKDMGGQMGGLSGTTTVNITLTDVNNNPPRFPQSKRVFSDIMWKVSQTHCEQLNVFAPSLCIQMNPQTLLQQNVTISLILKWRIHLQCRGCRFDPWVARQSRGGNGNPFRYSCLGNPIDRGAWWATVHGVSKSQTRLSNLTFDFQYCISFQCTTYWFNISIHYTPYKVIIKYGLSIFTTYFLKTLFSIGI